MQLVCVIKVIPVMTEDVAWSGAGVEPTYRRPDITAGCSR